LKFLSESLKLLKREPVVAVKRGAARYLLLTFVLVLLCCAGIFVAKNYDISVERRKGRVGETQIEAQMDNVEATKSTYLTDLQSHLVAEISEEEAHTHADSHTVLLLLLLLLLLL
jgi:hypothetical protein